MNDSNLMQRWFTDNSTSVQPQKNQSVEYDRGFPSDHECPASVAVCEPLVAKYRRWNNSGTVTKPMHPE
jgi:hypothetical protein